MRTIEKKENGFTLAEAILAVLILGIASVIVVLPFSKGAAIQKEGIHRTIAANLASELLEKIAYTECEQIVTNFDGYSEAEGGLVDCRGRLYTASNYNGFSRDASCDYVYVPQQGGDKVPNFILVTVRVCYHGSEIAEIHKLISK